MDYTKDEQLAYLLIALDLAISTRRFYQTGVDYGYWIINKQVADVISCADKCSKQVDIDCVRESLSEQSQRKIAAISEYITKQIDDIQQFKQDKWKIGLFAGSLLEAAHLAIIDALIICRSVRRMQPWRRMETAIRSLLRSMYNALQMEDEIVQGGMDLYMTSQGKC